MFFGVGKQFLPIISAVYSWDENVTTQFGLPDKLRFNASPDLFTLNLEQGANVTLQFCFARPGQNVNWKRWLDDVQCAIAYAQRHLRFHDGKNLGTVLA